jgi:threonine dehydrogenase-like Zn-dependent dehydrogenase
MMDFTRTLGIMNPQLLQRTHVAIIGAGGIGSATAIVLAKMGIGCLTLYDPDEIEDVNIPTQLLPLSGIGNYKVDGVEEIIRLLADTTVYVNNLAVGASRGYPVPGGMIVSALDSIVARKEVWQAVLNSPAAAWYLDARMGAENFQLYTVKMADHSWYRQHLNLLDEDSVPDEPCTSKTTIYTAFIAAGHIGHTVKRILMGQDVPRVFIHDIKRETIMMPARREDA